MNSKLLEQNTIMHKGEIRRLDLLDDIISKFKSDTFFDNAVAAMIILVICATVDFANFYQLFAMITYDSPLLMTAQISGMLFGFDVVPIYAGIQLRRYKEGFSKDKFLLYFAVVAFVMAFGINLALRYTTIDLMNASATSQGTLMGASESSANSGEVAISIAKTIFGMCLPAVTSIGSFFISYMTYDPRKVLSSRFSTSYRLKKDSVRRHMAQRDELVNDVGYAKRIEQKEVEKFVAAREQIINYAVYYALYVRTLMAERLVDPSATSALFEDDHKELFNRFMKQIEEKEGQIILVRHDREVEE